MVGSISTQPTTELWFMTMSGHFPRRELRALARSKKFVVLWATGVLTFAAFIVSDLSWGGSALNGKVEQGKYYLGERGKYLEVGRGTYAASAALSMIWPPAILLGVSQLRKVIPATPDNRKLFLVLTVFFSLGAATFCIASLVCLLRAII
jgi:hypothetical protein